MWSTACSIADVASHSFVVLWDRVWIFFPFAWKKNPPQAPKVCEELCPSAMFSYVLQKRILQYLQMIPYTLKILYMILLGS